MRCCTGLEGKRLLASLIASGEAELVVAGGAESMSMAEFYLLGEIKWGIGRKGAMPKGHGDLSICGGIHFTTGSKGQGSCPSQKIRSDTSMDLLAKLKGVLGEEVNVKGSGISLGHTISAAKPRLVAFLLNLFKENPKGRYGLITMCVERGQGYSIIWENLC